jgi:hypothetical protein
MPKAPSMDKKRDEGKEDGNANALSMARRSGSNSKRNGHSGSPTAIYPARDSESVAKQIIQAPSLARPIVVVSIVLLKEYTISSFSNAPWPLATTTYDDNVLLERCKEAARPLLAPTKQLGQVKKQRHHPTRPLVCTCRLCVRTSVPR